MQERKLESHRGEQDSVEWDRVRLKGDPELLIGSIELENRFEKGGCVKKLHRTDTDLW